MASDPRKHPRFDKDGNCVRCGCDNVSWICPPGFWPGNWPTLARLAAAEAVVAQARKAAAREDDGEIEHEHKVPGVWDESNGPPLGGTPCGTCADREGLRAALAAYDKARGTR